MTQIKKLEVVVKEWEGKSEELRIKAAYCREHNFTLQAQVLQDQRSLIDEILMNIRLKVIEQLIPM